MPNNISGSLKPAARLKLGGILPPNAKGCGLGSARLATGWFNHQKVLKIFWGIENRWGAIPRILFFRSARQFVWRFFSLTPFN